ncbi:hypothetical protein [Streptomyces roseochromogenus]|uniref:Uncharacterized protein n=1 Tax=Streptomyces roseochromogenus subsp. oscitans DS 12.976 TaxID=1352936 RepID=V6L3I5_STRRC|nr:hypothetical protein [Streptomyces roseochromogenus]EST35779.1 hypothetical protein M878_04450 [Streptomyces roseochromogenus subsp. oscitans DS 12.976]
MPTRPNTLRTLAGAALLPLALATPACGQSAAAPAPETPATVCSLAGTLHGTHGEQADVSLCADTGSPRFNITAPATCRIGRTRVRYACRTDGTWKASRSGKSLGTGMLPGSGLYPGPGTYDLSATVHVWSTPAGVDLKGTVQTTVSLTAPKAKVTHAVTVDQSVLHRNATTTVTYTIRRDSDDGDGNARLGMIGEAGTDLQITTADKRCVNPLVGRYPSKTRLAHSLDCTVTELQPGHPETLKIQYTVGAKCSTVVSKLGYWVPKGQDMFTGNMLAGPTLTCR